MDTAKNSSDKVPFLERPIVRTILPIAGFVIICVLFEILTNGRLFQPKNISLLLSQSYMLLISSIGVFMVMTMGGLDFSQGSMLGVASIVVCYLSHYNMILAAIGAGETAARFAGIRVETTKILVFVAAGCITGLAAFVNAIKVGSVTSTAGNQLETQIMIALVLGGMPVNGGAKVRFYNILLGVMTYQVLSSGLVMLMMPTQLQQLILGIIFLIEVAIFSDRKTGMIVK